MGSNSLSYAWMTVTTMNERELAETPTKAVAFSQIIRSPLARPAGGERSSFITSTTRHSYKVADCVCVGLDWLRLVWVGVFRSVAAGVGETSWVAS